MQIYVANLSPATTFDDLLGLFEQYGIVTGKVWMPDDKQARAAIHGLSELELHGKRIAVAEC